MTAPDNRDAAAAGQERTVSLDQALALAVERHQAGQLADAAVIYGELLKHCPDRPDLLNFMGILSHQRGDDERALALLRHAREVAPDSSGICNNLGNVLLHLDRTAEAEDAFRQSVAIAPNPEAHANIGRILRIRSDFVGSEAACRQALALEPEFGVAWHNLSLALLGQARLTEGVDAAMKAQELLPDLPRRRSQYASALLLAGEVERAADIYRKWLVEDPDNPYVQHQLVACSQGQQAPDRASDAYVEHVFDGFAATFDTKLASLDYCGPQLITDALAKVLPAPAAQFAIADLGCGTGQCGVMVRPWTRHLTGCDLSGAMIEKAQQRGVYDEFHKQELGAFLRGRPGAFDVVLSCDTLIYFGDLHGVVDAAATALRPGGWLAFTLEALPEDDGAEHRLMHSGRYAHSLACVRTTLAAAGLAELAIGRHVMRTEASQPVHGWIVTARRPG